MDLKKNIEIDLSNVLVLGNLVCPMCKHWTMMHLTSKKQVCMRCGFQQDTVVFTIIPFELEENDGENLDIGRI